MGLLRLIFAILFAPIRWLTNPITRPKNSLLEWHLSYGPFFVKRGLAEIPVKHCPNCERPVPPEQDICVCGYNFEEPNIELIEQVKSKRFRKNQINGFVMIIIGIISYLYFLLSADVSKIGKHFMDKFIYGIPGLLIIFGVYKIFCGRALKKPTKSPF